MEKRYVQIISSEMLDRGAQEIIERNPRFYAIDTEYNSQKEDGCQLIQIAFLGVSDELAKYTSPYLAQSEFLHPASIYIFRVSGLRTLPRILSRLLTNPNIIKVGCGISSDIERLKYYGIHLTRTVDIQDLAFSLGIQTPSLDFLSSRFCRLKKKDGVSWGQELQSEFLSTKMIEYAAYDVYLHLECYLQMIGYDKHTVDRPIEPSMKQLNSFYEWLVGYCFRDRESLPLDQLMRVVQNSYGELKKEYSATEEISLVKTMISHLSHLKYIIVNDGRVFLRQSLQFSTQEEKTPETSQDTLMMSLMKTTAESPMMKDATEITRKKTEKEGLFDIMRSPKLTHSFSSDDSMSTLPPVTKEEALGAFSRSGIIFPASGHSIETLSRCIANANWHMLNRSKRLERAYSAIVLLLEESIVVKRGGNIFLAVSK